MNTQANQLLKARIALAAEATILWANTPAPQHAVIAQPWATLLAKGGVK